MDGPRKVHQIMQQVAQVASCVVAPVVDEQTLAEKVLTLPVVKQEPKAADNAITATIDAFIARHGGVVPPASDFIRTGMPMVKPAQLKSRVA